jgi:hypothetical protein
MAAVVGYAPPAPSFVPDGFELLRMAVARSAEATGAAAGNPPSRDVAMLVYGDGFNRLTVTTRRAEGKRSAWSDPLAVREPTPEPTRAEISAGALDGVTASVVVAGGHLPHLWAVTDSLVVTVAGGVSADQLREVAESPPAVTDDPSRP